MQMYGSCVVLQIIFLDGIKYRPTHLSLFLESILLDHSKCKLKDPVSMCNQFCWNIAMQIYKSCIILGIGSAGVGLVFHSALLVASCPTKAIGPLSMGLCILPYQSHICLGSSCGVLLTVTIPFLKSVYLSSRIY